MTPYYQGEGITLYCADFRDVAVSDIDCVIADPPYNQTSLDWDKWPTGWLDYMSGNSIWVFGTLRMFMVHASEFSSAGWKLSQDLVWEKHNGSGFHADRFRRVHEQVALFYKGTWGEVYHEPQYTMDAVAKTVRRKTRPTHMGHIENAAFESVDGGPRLMRSVLHMPSEHGHALHPTQKPVDLIRPLIEYSCPAFGTVFCPFSGSGSELLAAKLCGRDAIGCEINEKFCEIAAKRLESMI